MTALHPLDQLLIDRLTNRDVVLDIGSGTGNFARAAGTRAARTITVDPSKRASADLRVAVADGPPLFIDRRTVRRVADTRADDAREVASTTLTALIAEHRPTAIRFRALGQETQLHSVDPGITIVAHLDQLVSKPTIRSSATLINGELTTLADNWPTSRLAVALGDAWPKDHASIASQWCNAALAEATVTEPARRSRLAHLLEADTSHHTCCAPIADQLSLDPADEVADSMHWWTTQSTHLPPTERLTRRLAAFNHILDALTATPPTERPSPLSLPL